MAPHRAAEWGREIYMFQRRQNPWLPNLLDPTAADFVPVPDSQHSHFAVIEVRLRLFSETTVNLLDQNWVEHVRSFFDVFQGKERTIEDAARAKTNYEFMTSPAHQGQATLRRLIPQIDGHIRTRDCLFFNEFLREYPEVQSVVATFAEGDRLVQGINIGERDHVQINVVDQSIIDVTDFTIRDADEVLGS